ncbi:glycosyltransferase family 2 protein [Akkermansia glycaniphila]|uniref:Nucleotide-diphospho-sugar transferases n=1 Tax=Akkermansia glycaniphila TaxID=1679444 RepID=A0A1H6MQ40_9BACT|nr:glycosyltransferase [Akkermansia glycaniphila]MBT9449576.1 glycosyltransferase [Akkermansia glycaniphila]SEI01594.1 nucleotide-diphospho-sugar transferases [Akkermansia glycaniphila]
MPSPLISIVVPVYNVASYLRECLESILEQTYENLEVICVNDGSTDGSLAILEEYRSRDSRVRVISKPNAGYGHTMNMGMDAATGDYLGIVESDDFIEPRMYEILMTAQQKHDVPVVLCPWFDYWTDGNRKKCSFPRGWRSEQVFCPLDRPQIFSGNPAIWAALYDLNWLRANGIRFLETPGASFQDMSFSFKVLAKLEKICVVPDVLLNYRRDNENSSMNSKHKVFCIFDETDEMRAFFNSACEGNTKIRDILFKRSYEVYRANLKRIALKYKLGFLHRMSQETKKHFSDNEGDNQFLEEKDILNLRALSRGVGRYLLRRSLSPFYDVTYKGNTRRVKVFGLRVKKSAHRGAH